MEISIDYYKILTGKQTEWDLYEIMIKSFQDNIENEANKQGYSTKYTLIDGRIVRRNYE